MSKTLEADIFEGFEAEHIWLAVKNTVVSIITENRFALGQSKYYVLYVRLQIVEINLNATIGMQYRRKKLIKQWLQEPTGNEEEPVPGNLTSNPLEDQLRPGNASECYIYKQQVGL